MTEEERTRAEESTQTEENWTEEIKVQTDELLDTLNSIIREGTAKRITILRNDRVLVDIPLVLGVGASLVLAYYLPVLSAIVGVGALLTGCTVRVEREQPPTEE